MYCPLYAHLVINRRSTDRPHPHPRSHTKTHPHVKNVIMIESKQKTAKDRKQDEAQEQTNSSDSTASSPLDPHTPEGLASNDNEIEAVTMELDGDALDGELEGDVDGNADGLTVTTTTGSGPNKRKEILSMPMAPGSLPPRKRAKTKDEKEQRRIERIMRNRQAAHASREKKRKHLEDLEQKCTLLTSENEALRRQARDTKEGQMQMLEQQYLLMTRFQQLQSLVKTARATGDLSVLDSVENMAAAMTAVNQNAGLGSGVGAGGHNTPMGLSISPVSTTTSSLTPSPNNGEGCRSDECASPESLVLGGFDSQEKLAGDEEETAKPTSGEISAATSASSTTNTKKSRTNSTTKTTTAPTTNTDTSAKPIKQEHDDFDFGFGRTSNAGSLFCGANAESPSYSLKTESDSDSEMYMFEPPLHAGSDSLAQAHHPAAVMPPFFDQQRRRKSLSTRVEVDSTLPRSSRMQMSLAGLVVDLGLDSERLHSTLRPMILQM